MSRSNTFTALACFSAVLALTACGSHKVDMSDPNAVAQAFVTAYQKRDLERMASLIPNENDRQQLLTKGRASETYRTLYDLQEGFISLFLAPDPLETARYERDTDCVLFRMASYESQYDDERYALGLCLSETTNGQYYVEDVYSYDEGKFQTFPDFES